MLTKILVWLLFSAAIVLVAVGVVNAAFSNWPQAAGCAAIAFICGRTALHESEKLEVYRDREALLRHPRL